MHGIARLEGRYDAVVVGARVAGAATAMLLARAGLRVLAVDHAPEGGDTLSTHALMRGGVLQLSRWGLLPALAAAATPAIRTTTFHYGDEVVEVPIQERDGVAALLAPRRTVLDPLLVAAARTAGATVAHRVRAFALERDAGGRARGVMLADDAGRSVRVGAGIVVGADGRASGIARLAGAEVRHAATRSAPCLYRLVPGLGVDGYHWHFRPGVSGGLIPTNGGQCVVFVSVPAARWARERPAGLERLFTAALAELDPALAARVARRAGAGPIRAFAGAPGFLRRAHGPGWALVGDAGAFRDPITSHGMTDALRDAGWLADAILRGTGAALADYEAARDAVTLDMIRVSEAIAGYEWDLEQVRVLHHQFSKLMARELEAMRAWPGPAVAPPAPRPLSPPSSTGRPGPRPAPWP